MPRRKRPAITEITTAAAQYIAAQLDGTNWERLLKEHAFCAGCPVRTGPQLEDDRIENYCLACPLRGWLLTTAELALRARQRTSAPPRSNRDTKQAP